MSVQRLWVKQQKAVFQQWNDLLQANGIRMEKHVDEVYGIYEDAQLVATGAIFDNVIKCVAVSPQHTGGTLISQLISHLEQIIFERYDACYLYTKPSAAVSFTHLGFKEIARVPDILVFMEKATRGLTQYLQALAQKKRAGATHGAIVMNANPFTKGHLYLVETAAQQVDVVYLFVVSQDRSYVPFADRFALVQQGVAHLDNVVVLETSAYMVSTATFPSYFLPEQESVARVQAALDATIFGNHIVPTLELTHRFIGSEPLSVVTNLYNEQLLSILSSSLTVTVVERKIAEGDVISASRVRQLWQEGNIEAATQLVPPTTAQYIIKHRKGVKCSE